MTRGMNDDAPSWEILERDDFEYDATTRRLLRRLMVWDLIRATTIPMAVMLGIALAGFTLYAICPEPIDLLIKTVADHPKRELAIDEWRMTADPFGGEVPPPGPPPVPVANPLNGEVPPPGPPSVARGPIL